MSIQINHESLITQIKKTQLQNYDESILIFYTDEIMKCNDDLDIENEDDFNLTFSDFIYYIQTLSFAHDYQGKEKKKFKKIIDHLTTVSLERQLDNIDVNYILFKEEVLKLITSFKNGKLTEKILKEQLYKCFNIKDYDYLINQLIHRYKISF